MANTKCTHEVKWKISIYLVAIFVVGAATMFIMGGIMYQQNLYAKTIHEENSCEVTASNYYESRCYGHRGSGYNCFKPVWLVSYSVLQDVTEIHVYDATIDEGGHRTIAPVEHRLNQYQIGVSYTCWCNVIDPYKAKWDEPSTFNGMMILIFGGVATILCFVGIFFSYRARKIIKNIYNG